MSFRPSTRLPVEIIVALIYLLLSSSSSVRSRPPTFLGPVFSTEYDSFGKLDFNDLEEGGFERESSGGWLAIVQRYFVSCWVPEQ